MTFQNLLEKNHKKNFVSDMHKKHSRDAKIMLVEMDKVDYM